MELQYVVTPITATFMITRDVMEGELELKRVNFNPGIGRHECFRSESGRSTARAVVLATFFHRHTKIPRVVIQWPRSRPRTFYERVRRFWVRSCALPFIRNVLILVSPIQWTCRRIFGRALHFDICPNSPSRLSPID